MEPLLELQELKKYFEIGPNRFLHAVDGVSFKLEKGKTLGVVGESGCGKSTLGRTILHLLNNTGGKIIYKGQDITRPDGKMKKRLREEMQIIFQDPFSSLDPRFSVRDMILEPLVIQGMMSKKEMNIRVEEVLETVGVPERLYNAYPHELDGGRRQRVGIARALALNPQFIVCDEPVSALDVSIQAQIINLLLDLQEKNRLTYIFITHDLAVVKYISNDIIVMYLGEVVEKASADGLFRTPLHPYTQALLSAVPLPDVHAKKERELLKGELTSPVNPAPGCRFMTRCKYAEEACGQKQVLREAERDHFVACHRINVP